MPSSYEQYLELLRNFEKLPKKSKSESIFDIAGYPHYENVVSNLLAFFFNPNNEHGLGNLFFSSLMSLADGNELYQNNMQINREVSTNKGGRLDIVIETDNQIIGIENKIFHHLNNDLLDYSDSIDEMAKTNNLNTIKIILSMRKEQESHGFVCVTYEEFLSRIKERLGGYASTSSQKWLLYLVDFMSTIERLSGERMELDSNDNFFIENEERVNALLNARNKFVAKLNSRVSELLAITEKPNKCEKQWIYDKTCLVHNFVLSENSIAFDLYISAQGWELQLFGRNATSQTYLKKLFLVSPMSDCKVELKDSRYILWQSDLSVELDTIREKLYEWFNLIIEAEHNNKIN